jgi:hypothetical protein
MIRIDLHVDPIRVDHYVVDPDRCARIDFTVGPVSDQSLNPQPKGILMFVMTDSQKTKLSIAVVDKKGNPADVDGAPTWTSSDPSIVAVTPSEDGFTADVVAVGPIGQAQVNVTVDADMGEGKTELSGVLDVQIVGGAAASVAISADVAEEQ